MSPYREADEPKALCARRPSHWPSSDRPIYFVCFSHLVCGTVALGLGCLSTALVQFICALGHAWTLRFMVRARARRERTRWLADAHLARLTFILENMEPPS